MRSQVLHALTLGECFERQQWHNSFFKPGEACRHARRRPAAMPGEPTASARCRPVAREETFYEIESDVAIVAVGRGHRGAGLRAAGGLKNL